MTRFVVERSGPDVRVADVEREALRAMLGATEVGQLSDILVEAVRRLGADVGGPTGAAQDEVALNLALGCGPAVVPRVAAESGERLLVERVVPPLVEVAIELAAQLRGAGPAGPTW